MFVNTLQPRLIVPDPDAATSYYQAALAAEVRARHTQDDLVVHAELAVGDAGFTLAAEVADWGLLAPGTVGGTPVLLRLDVADARVLADRMAGHGARVVIPVEDRPYGRCEGRLEDPFGHLWIPTHALADRTA